jgi:hypothetical protein
MENINYLIDNFQVNKSHLSRNGIHIFFHKMSIHLFQVFIQFAIC